MQYWLHIMVIMIVISWCRDRPLACEQCQTPFSMIQWNPSQESYVCLPCLQASALSQCRFHTNNINNEKLYAPHSMGAQGAYTTLPPKKHARNNHHTTKNKQQHTDGQWKHLLLPSLKKLLTEFSYPANCTVTSKDALTQSKYTFWTSSLINYTHTDLQNQPKQILRERVSAQREHGGTNLQKC